MTTCKFCGTNLEVEAEMNQREPLFVEHSCHGPMWYCNECGNKWDINECLTHKIIERASPFNKWHFEMGIGKFWCPKCENELEEVR